MPGLVELLTVATDAQDSLIDVIRILQRWNSSVSHYRTGIDVDGKPYLILMWNEGDGRTKGTPLMARMTDPRAIADQLYSWLTEQQYGEEPDHDGSNRRGWKATQAGPAITRVDNPHHDPKWEYSQRYNCTYDRSSHDVICVQPHWIEYHK